MMNYTMTSNAWVEFWSIIQSKSNQRWTWYLIERPTGFIIAREKGRRKDKVLLKFYLTIIT